jgi:hypothetical protein
MIAAITLVQEYFWPHARAALRQIGLSDRHHHIRRVLRWIRANRHAELSLKDIRRDALAGTVDVERTRDVVERMIAAGWLRAEPVTKTGGRPRERWLSNPRLFAPAETAETAESPLPADPAVPATTKTAKF